MLVVFSFCDTKLNIFGFRQLVEPNKKLWRCKLGLLEIFWTVSATNITIWIPIRNIWSYLKKFLCTRQLSHLPRCCYTANRLQQTKKNTHSLKCTHKHFNCVGNPNVTPWMNNTGVVMETPPSCCHAALLSSAAIWLDYADSSVTQPKLCQKNHSGKQGHSRLRAVDASADCASSRPWQSWRT